MGCCVSQKHIRVNPSVGKENQQTVNTEFSERTVKDDEKKSCKTGKFGEEVPQPKQVSMQRRKQSDEGQIIVKDDRGENNGNVSVAFEIPFRPNYEEKPVHPRRLKKLIGAPHLTAEILKEKQERAERNRNKELHKKTETTSKHQRNAFKNREIRKLKDAEMQLQVKLMTTEANRQNHIQQIILKQKEHNQKAKRVMEKASLNNNEMVYVEETYMSDESDEDIWNDSLTLNS